MDSKNTGTFISELRKEKHMTQAELADRICVSDKAVSRWETGKGFPEISNLEALSATLGVTIAELLNGEHMAENTPEGIVQEADAGWLKLVRGIAKKGKIGYALFGFLLGFAVIILAAVHLASPIYISDPDKAVQIEELSGRIVAIVSEQAAGIEVDSTKNPESGENEVFISCYQTRWNQITKESRERIISLGDKEEIASVFYYPAEETEGGSDIELYRNSSLPETNGGVVTLPRLIYRYWIVLGFAASILGIAAYWILRKKYYAVHVFRAAMVPAALTLSMLLCLWGKYDEVYNAQFYLSGILLMGIAIYALIILFSQRLKNRKSAEN